MKIKFNTLLVICVTLVTVNLSAKSIVVKNKTGVIFQEEKIVLNNGKKWVIVPGMMVFLKNMDQAVVDFSKVEKHSESDYKSLAVTIDKNIRDLTANCTMKGQGHDELHKWLVPFIELSREFDVAKDIASQKAIYQKFQESFKIFHTYFR